MGVLGYMVHADIQYMRIHMHGRPWQWGGFFGLSELLMVFQLHMIYTAGHTVELTTYSLRNWKSSD